MIATLSVSIALALFAPAVSADLGKTALFSNGLNDPLGPGLEALPVPSFTISSVSVPSICASHASDSGCANSVEAFSVTYNDCSGDPWTLCRCTNANLDQNTMARRFGQVPPGVRSYVGGALAVSASSCSAGSGGDFIVFNGDCAQSVFDHESGHSLDQNTSPSSTWSNALAGSSCVPDAYADTSVAEDFAQVNVMYTYKTRVGAFPADASCMQPQLDVFANTARLASAHSATTCNAGVRPFDLSTVVNATRPAARYSGLINVTYFHENPQ